MLAVWLYFLGIYQVYFHRGDISVDVVVHKLREEIRYAVFLCVHVAVIGAISTIAWQALKLILVQLPFKTPGTAMPTALFTAPLLIGSVLMALTMLERLLEALARRNVVEIY